MGAKIRKLMSSEPVKTIGSYAFRKLDIAPEAPEVNLNELDVFFDFKTFGNLDSHFTLANQGALQNITLAPYSGSFYGDIVSGVGAKLSKGTTYYDILSMSEINEYTNQNLANGAKTIAFRITESELISNRNARIIGVSGNSNYGSIGIGASGAEIPYHAFARATPTSGYFYARAIDKDYSIDGTHFAWIGGNKNYNNRNVIITCGSKENPSPIKIYIDGSLVGIFDIAGSAEPSGYMNIGQSNYNVHLFGHRNSSSAQAFASATVSYFAMTQGEMTASEVAKLNQALNAIA